ncbi:hypothetical protein KM427_22470 [Nocardioides sp. LMS-CY]|uniref:hypothetical protein n=1 Tax=Nocardioides sp. (strain LMS-CY) TaxID=2840457 RepID=UPI001BFFDD7F|nr:hypothetical protein [Nocardioides sp. LMS-CY]QWF21658.1 hypothetical protein KM427_22470 [Nocardioides sp. LMS-CY]
MNRSRLLASRTVVPLAMSLAVAGTTAYATARIMPKNSVVSASIKDGQVKRADLAKRAVGPVKLASGAVRSGHVRAGALSGRHLGPGSVARQHLAPGAVARDQLAPGSVGRDQLASGSVARDHIAPDSVGRNQLASGSVTRDHLAPGSVTGDQVADGSLTAADLDTTTLGMVPAAQIAGLGVAGRGLCTPGSAWNACGEAAMPMPQRGHILAHATVDLVAPVGSSAECVLNVGTTEVDRLIVEEPDTDVTTLRVLLMGLSPVKSQTQQVGVVCRRLSGTTTLRTSVVAVSVGSTSG